MAFNPKGAKWYLADVVLEFIVQDDARNVVHINTVLVEASSPEDAYKKAIELGKSDQSEYLNTNGKKVKVRFRGLKELNVIHDDLDHGTELTYREEVGLSEGAIKKLTRNKSKLGVFQEIMEKADVPNYLPISVWRLIEAHFGPRDLPHP